MAMSQNGKPPRSRGKQRPIDTRYSLFRKTPALAGRTKAILPNTRAISGNPRAHGANSEIRVRSFSLMGKTPALTGQALTTKSELSYTTRKPFQQAISLLPTFTADINAAENVRCQDLLI